MQACRHYFRPSYSAESWHPEGGPVVNQGPFAGLLSLVSLPFPHDSCPLSVSLSTPSLSLFLCLSEKGRRPRRLFLSLLPTSLCLSLLCVIHLPLGSSRYLAEMEMRLHLSAEDVEAALEDASSRALLRIPSAVQEVAHVKVRAEI